MNTLTYQHFAAMLRAAARNVRSHHEELSKLDSFGGDGDHGTTMARAMERLEQALASVASESFQVALQDVGWAIMGVDGGATGPLLGTLFSSMADPAEGKNALTAAELAALFEAGLAGVRRQTKAQIGDKTMLDALVPAVEAMRAAADGGGDIIEVMHRGAAAAEQGAASTKALQARFGRAKNIGEKSIGAQDPGATSVAFLFQGFLEGVKSNA